MFVFCFIRIEQRIPQMHNHHHRIAKQQTRNLQAIIDVRLSRLPSKDAMTIPGSALQEMLS